MLKRQIVAQFKNKYFSQLCSRKSSQFKTTIHLPQTTFPLHVKDISKHETELQEVCGFSDLYEWQWKANRKNKPFVLHDGPPYANGDVHVGHALNKILKDITNRYQLLQGCQINYKPGWDCHGLPIEIKAIQSNNTESLTAMEIRQKAKSFALNAIANQKLAFKRWGVMADWKNLENCYFTFNKEYQSLELKAFYDMYKKNLIYRDLKPVYWSPSSQTALAESELEYNDNHVSRSVYVSFPIVDSSCQLNLVGDKAAIVWTTQPWTLPANQALCYNHDIKYSFVRMSTSNGSTDLKQDTLYLLATDTIPQVSSLIGVKFDIVETFHASNLEGLLCTHPMDANRPCKLLSGSHTTTEKGSGIVHTAPAHGVDDFQISQLHDLPNKSHIDNKGCFTDEAGFNMKGKFIFTEGNEAVISMLQERGNLLFSHDFVHRYPYDWRTKKAIFVKTSRQWFIDTQELQKRSLNALSGVKIYPHSGEDSMKAMLKMRTYWCISRQRAWGLPIPAFFHKETGATLINDSSMRHLQSLIKCHGADIWFSSSVEELLPKEAIQEAGYNGSPSDFEKGADILDIWFDSGISWAAVLGDCSHIPSTIADFYVEGKDQYNGWFQSSLLTSVALRDKAPYKNLMVHGFTVAGDGQKMSKSLGNVIDPMVLVDGGKNKQANPAYGADALRWWVAQSSVYTEIHMSKKLMDDAAISVQKIRNCLRFMLSNLNGFSIEKSLVCEDMRPIDQYFMRSLKDYVCQVNRSWTLPRVFCLVSNGENLLFTQSLGMRLKLLIAVQLANVFQLKCFLKITDWYDTYKYSSVCNTTLNFTTALSAVYFSILKDRLYCEEKDSAMRRSGQTVLYHTVEALTKAIAPILPHLVEEVYLHHPCAETASAFKNGWFENDVFDALDNSTIHAPVEVALHLRKTFHSLINDAGSIQPASYDATITVPDDNLMTHLSRLQSDSETSETSDLCEILSCAKCSLTRSGSSTLSESSAPIIEEVPVKISDIAATCVVTAQLSSNHKCPRCRKNSSKTSGRLCERCTFVLSDRWDL